MADAIEEARTLYFDAQNALTDQRRQIEEDLRFSNPSDPQQWDDRLKRQRENDPGGSRPCLVFDQCGQYVSNVAGQIEQRPPSLHALPVDGGADKKVAENLDGFFRHIEHVSRAQQHYARALTSAARCGVGYLVVQPDYVNRALNWQEPRIMSHGDPLRVTFDPWSVELDGSDADFGYVLTPYSHRQWDMMFKGKEKVSFTDPEGNLSRDDKQSIYVADQWVVEKRRVKMCVVLTPEMDEVALTEDEYEQSLEEGKPLQKVGEYTEDKRMVKWRRMSGADLIAESDYPADSIGIVPVYGYVGWAEGRMTYCGIPRRAMNPQRSYNYHMSEIQAYMASAPKAPWITPIRAIKGLEPLWDKASTEQRAFLPYNDMDEMGAISAPQRPAIAVNLQNHMAGAERALQDIQASIGMYQANLGAPSNEQSGVAIDARKEQGEASTAHFPAHLSASIAQVGRIVMQMIPKLIDGKRQLRILGIDGTIGEVTVNPKQEAAVQETDKGLSINPNVGHYDVRVVVGAAYSTQRSQAQEAFTEMMRANPAMTPAIAPLWAQTLDVPHADKLAQVLTAVAPPEVKAVLQPQDSEEPSTAELTAKVTQLSQALEAAIQEAQQAQQEVDEAHAEARQAKAAADAKEDEVAIRAYDALTKRLQVMGATITPEAVQALVQQTIAATMAQPQPSEEAQEMPEPMEAMAPEMPEVPEEQEMPEEQGPAPEIQALLQGQETLAQMMGQLIQLVQADRERIPVRDKTGAIERVLDRMVRPETLQ